MQIAVIGASGNTGRAVAQLALDDGHDLRAVVRNPGACSDLAALGAEVAAADLDDPESAVSRRIQATGARPPQDRFHVGPKIFYTHAKNFSKAVDMAFNPPSET